MPTPKRKTSKSRRNKRRTHQKLTPPHMLICPTTGVAHRPHVQYSHGGHQYYQGRRLHTSEEVE
ncbi:MAG: 50S ribosomal protein L32 [Cytophagales bacterium]